MAITARSVFSTGNDSLEEGRRAAAELREHLGGAPTVALTYLTINHDQAGYLRGLREVLGPETCIVGTSGQGVMGRGTLREEGYAAGVMGLRDRPSSLAGAFVEDIQLDTAAKGRALGASVVARLGERPKVVVLHYDPLRAVDMDVFLDGLYAEVQCPIIGGASAHFYGPMQTTFQYFDDRVLSRGAVAVGMTGDSTFEHGLAIGCSPLGVEMTVTRASGNKVLELDGRPAVDVWSEITGTSDRDYDHTASLALGVPHGHGGKGAYLIRAAFGVDQGGVVVQVSIPEGTRVMLQHRTVADILDGTRALAADLKKRLAGKTIRAVLGFECGARTVPFLGKEVARDENIELQKLLAPDAAWLGMIAWGELYPVGGRPGFHNYTFPMLAIAD